MSVYKEKYDIILLQEHWLWTFEADVLGDLFPDHDYTIKCADHQENIPNDVRRHGKHGIATAWKRSISHLVEVYPDGSERICVITIKCLPSPICIINVYMPAQGSEDFKMTYADHLDQIFEIKQKFSDHITVLGGDLNGSVTAPTYPHDHKLKALLNEIHMVPPDNYQNHNTIFSHNGSKRQIDYLLCSHNEILEVKKPINPAINTSTHCLLPASLDVALTITTSEVETMPPPIARKIKWDKIYVVDYKLAICKSLDASPTTSNIEDMHEVITSCLIEAATQAPPSKATSKRKSKIPVSDKVKMRLQQCREVYKQIKNRNGKVAGATSLKAAKKSLRRAIRMELAKNRKELYINIMKSDTDKDQLFYKLIALQRKTKQTKIQTLRVEGQIISDQRGILKAWASHFEKLGTETFQPHFDQDHHNRVTQTKKCISEFIDTAKPYTSAPPISNKEVEKAIQKLNSGKAADKRGISAEHLKKAGPHILTAISTLLTSALHAGIQPASFTTGTLTPVGKKDKDLMDRNNSRGIVISPILAKVFEHVIDQREQVADSTDPLQFGFTEGRSPTMASLLTTEAIAESIDTEQPIFIASLDTQKAFDVVWQDSLAIRLFIKKPIEYWKAHTKLLEDTSLQVKLNGHYSEPFTVTQGVGQGKILSTKNYKDFIEAVLSICRRSARGCHIGIFFVATPTCADDIILMANSEEHLQLLLSIAHEYSRQERYNIHPQKTRILVYNSKGPENLYTWKLGETLVKPSKILTHLGINRYATSVASNDTIQDRITSARRVTYGLMKAGFHGTKGLANPCLRRILNLYILPRLLYALESLVVTSKQTNLLDAFLKDLLKRIQALPQRTANEAPYLLFHTIPAEGLLNIKLLSFFGKIIADDSSILYQVCERQLATKTLSSNSWFVSISKLCLKYNLPSSHHLLQNPMKEQAWKRVVKTAVNGYWYDKLRDSAQEKTTLKRIWLEQPTWEHVDLNPFAVDRARLQARLLTDTLTLQYHRAKFYGESPTCKLCNMEDETVDHMLARCPALSQTRSSQLQPIFGRMQSIGEGPPRCEEETIQLLLGFTSDPVIYKLGSNACFAILHLRHILYLDYLDTPG